jgi:UDP-glucose 6-dehydrogenase
VATQAWLRLCAVRRLDARTVVCLDSDTAKIETLRAGRIPIHERYLEELLERSVDGYKVIVEKSTVPVYTSDVCDETPRTVKVRRASYNSPCPSNFTRSGRVTNCA